jgi:hypothetical protein
MKVICKQRKILKSVRDERGGRKEFDGNVEIEEMEKEQDSPGPNEDLALHKSTFEPESALKYTS